MKGHEISITFLRKTWDQTCLVFMLSALKRTTAKTYFLHYDIWVKLYRFYHTCYFTRTFPHSYAASFSMKTCFYKINIFCLRTKNQCLLWDFSKFCLRQQLLENKDICTKMSSCNIFKTANTKMLITAILESPYKLLQTS